MPVKEKRRLEVLLETHEFTTVRFRNGVGGRLFCQACGTETLHLSISEAALILKSSEFEIFKFVQGNRIHSVETLTGTALVCGDSLSVLAKESG